MRAVCCKLLAIPTTPREIRTSGINTIPVDPIDGQRHTITKGYNLANGTVTSVTDQLGHTTSFTYDDYKRLLTTTTPPRFSGDTMNHTSSVYYDANGTGSDYTLTDA